MQNLDWMTCRAHTLPQDYCNHLHAHGSWNHDFVSPNIPLYGNFVGAHVCLAGLQVLCVLLIHLWSKLACYAMSNDVQFQLVIMMLVSHCHLVVSIFICALALAVCSAWGELIFGVPLL